MDLLRCSRCKTEKPQSEFPPRKNRPSGRQSYCRVCNAAANAAAVKKNRYVHAQRVASYHGRKIEISKEAYDDLVRGSCAYCTGPLSDQGIGLDRVNPLLGYVDGNLVPCCPLCNMVKADRFTPEEMALFLGPAILKVLRRRKKNGAPPRVGRWTIGRTRGK